MSGGAQSSSAGSLQGPHASMPRSCAPLGPIIERWTSSQLLLAEVLNPVDHSRTAAVHGCTNVACKERRRDGFVRLLQETADALESNSSLGTMHDVQVAHSPESQPLTLTSTFWPES